MKNKIKFAALFSVIAMFFSGARADVNMNLYVYYDCGACKGAIEYINTHLKYEYPMLNVVEIDMDAPTNEQLQEFNQIVETCWLESRGLPIFHVNGKCVQGYGPIEESHPDLKYLMESALTEKEKSQVEAIRTEMNADPDAYRAKVDTQKLADEQRAAAALEKGPIATYWYFIAGAVALLAVIGLALGKRKNRK